MREFRYSICEPTNPKIIEKGKIDSSEIMQIFQNFPWKTFLEETENIYYSPSLEFENLSNKNGLSISAVGNPEKFEFYVFFKRSKMQKNWFGLIEKLNNNYTSELLDQSKEKTIELLKAFVDNNLSLLERKFE
ncbi:hypothetical protein EV143_102153 [Flavobacterium chryseum]|uniref:hypothetical protein n=1 Tax=Flavobacterium sp. P3160 TaxID=2512113 RepID=UPI0010D0BCA3|nr:hypothetical protein [Flavobacterium sp. P3160]TDO82892.1 hypothetical protein EV143_102153 [Flavobacterium sp. P3160]